MLYTGNFSMTAGATPLMHESIFSAAKKVPNPNDTEIAAGIATVYDKWLKAFPAGRGGKPL